MTSFNQAKEESKYSKKGSITKSQASCLICYNEFSQTKLFTSLKCKHTFCRQCCSAYLEFQIQSFLVLDIKCPHEGCTEIFSDAHIREILEADKYNRYHELVLLKLIKRNSISYVCPEPGCARPIQVSKGNEKNQNLTCKCGTQICKTCFNYSHPGMSCLQNLDPDFESYMQANNIKYCPMCKTPVIRVGGCNNMVCCVCDYEWCWACGKHLSPTHVCTGSWDPATPSLYEEKSWIQTLIDKLRPIGNALLQVAALPFRFVYGLVFWPLYFTKREYAERHDAPSPEETTFDIVCQYVVCGTIGLVLLPVAFVVRTLYILGNASDLLREFGQAHFLPTYAEPPRRWKAGDIDTFAYTEKSRPDNRDQPEPQVHRGLTANQEQSAALSPEVNAPRRVQSLPSLPAMESMTQNLSKSSIQLNQERGDYKIGRDLYKQSERVLPLKGDNKDDMVGEDILYGDDKNLTEEMLGN